MGIEKRPCLFVSKLAGERGCAYMRKILVLAVSIMLIVMFAGCSNEIKDVAELDKEPKETETEVKKEVVEEVKKEKYYFDGEVAEIQDLKIKIIETKVIQPGEEGNEYSDKPVFAIWYEATNKSDKEVDAGTAWIVIFDMIQDNNDNFVNKLEVASLPDKKYLDMTFNNIKKDGTVEYAIAYELDDETTPVTLIATRGIGGEEIGRYDFDLD